jgi:hypothetical protein
LLSPLEDGAVVLSAVTLASDEEFILLLGSSLDGFKLDEVETAEFRFTLYFKFSFVLSFVELLEARYDLLFNVSKSTSTKDTV